jgi:hypothetical protein
MADFTLSAVTIPTPEPYDDKDPQRQLENLAFVLLQMIQQAKTAGFVFSDVAANAGGVDLTDITQAVNDLKYNGEVIDLGPIQIHLTGKTLSVFP